MEKTKFDVVTVGSAVLDILLRSSSFKLLKSREFPGGVAICEAYEGKMEADEIVVASGGGGSNNAVSFARKGLKTAVIAEMGDDVVGRMVSAELTKEKVDTRYMITEEGEETGISVVLISGEGGRSIVTYRGASRMLTERDIPWNKLSTRWLHISSLGGRMRLLEVLVAWAKKKGIHIALNPGKKELLKRERLWKIVKEVDVLLMNREEAKLLTGVDYTDMEVFRSEECLVGPRISIITAGKHGGRVCFEGKCTYYSGTKPKKVSSLGAGDAFGSGFVAGLIHGKRVEVATDWGKRNSESVLKFLTAKEGLLRLSELRQN
jgi:sugar/nucleoside kinase (ribokinase family)